MVLATTSAQEARPRARTVLLKAHGADGFTFYTNRTSRKAQDLQAHPQACAVFPWYALGRQVTAEGRVRMLSQAESKPCCRSTAPRVADRGLGQQAVAGHRVPRRARKPGGGTGAARWSPPAGGPDAGLLGRVRCRPRHGSSSGSQGAYRLHDRLRYRRDGDGWAIEHLLPSGKLSFVLFAPA